MSSSRIRVLVPVSERKRSGGSRAFSFGEAQEERSFNRFPSLSSARSEALDAFLSAVNGKGFAAEVLRLRGAALERAATLNLAFHRSPLLPVVARERGPLFRGLGLPLTADGRPDPRAGAWVKRLNEDLIILCPLLGLVAPGDQVPEYRCPIGAQIPEWGSLHAFWKPRVTGTLNRLCRERTVFSFLPARLLALWDDDGRATRIVTVAFERRAPAGILPENAGGAGPAGELVRTIFEARAGAPEDVFGFRSSAGHAFDPARSRLEGRRPHLVFVRDA